MFCSFDTILQQNPAINCDYHNTYYNQNMTKVMLKLLIVLICLQASWVQAFDAVGIASEHHQTIFGSEQVGHNDSVGFSGMDCHDCDKCGYQCHQSFLHLMQSAQTTDMLARILNITYTSDTISRAPPNQIDRPKWDATAL
jgi:NAD-dependent dihydropyrimidine dehydrogenase PreA subunit